jgi:FkbM family methyltransferase
MHEYESAIVSAGSPSIKKKILIYGAGAFGREILSDLKKNSIPVVAFLDKNAQPDQRVCNIPVYAPEKAIFPFGERKEISVILSIVLTEPARKEIISNLHRLGYVDIIDAQTLRALRVPYSHEKMEPEPDELRSEKEGILKAFSILGDEHSRQIYEKNLRAHFERDYQKTPESIGTIQYFAPGIPHKLRFSRFVDCGAYTGDTLSTLVKGHDVHAYAGFEPGSTSFRQLSTTADNLAESVSCILFPCAVSEFTGMTSFSDIAGSGAIGNNGTCLVPAVRLDDVLKNFEPSIIKMDIEGEEYHALLGAKKMIAQYKPDLAICVYHYIRDLWQILHLINSWDLGYSFYLRSHSSATMETVLYAVVRGGD